MTNDTEGSSETTTSKSSLLPEQQRIIKQLLQTSTALGRAMSDLFVLLVKLSVGSAQRQRRAPHTAATPGLPTLPARHVALQLSKVLKDALTWQGLPSNTLVPKLRFVCNSEVTLLFNNRWLHYHNYYFKLAVFIKAIYKTLPSKFLCQN